MPPEICPHCGAEVPPNAKACPQCGSCDATGWSDKAAADRLDLPDDSFDYDAFVKEEFDPPERSRRRPGWFWWLVAAVITALILIGFIL
ncbi:MAG: zinc-ribbon domain-containing protein [Limisphaerales bacterium]